MSQEPSVQYPTSTGVRRLADFALAVSDSAIPAGCFERAKLLLLDTLGCGFAGLDEQSAQSVVEAMRDLGGAPNCTVIGQRWKTNLANATLANGVLVRAHDLNDYVVNEGGSIGGHPSDNIPAALAAGEMFGRSGRAILGAIILGYEVFGRLRAAMDRKSQWDGVSVSAAVGAVTVGRLMGLDREQLSHAIALALAHCAVPAIVRSGHISAAKSIANALVAQSGVQAAILASRGVTGPLEIFEHRRGLGSLFSNAEALEMIGAPLKSRAFIEQARVKAFPCLATGQAVVAAGLELHRLLNGDYTKLQYIRVIMGDYPVIRQQQADPGRVNPLSREAADHSFHFLTAAALVDGEFSLRQFANERWMDPAIRNVMGRLRMEVDTNLNGRAPDLYPCLLEAHHKDGKVSTIEVLKPPGYSGAALDELFIIDKFNALTRHHLQEAKRNIIVAAALALPEAKSVANLVSAMASGVRTQD